MKNSDSKNSLAELNPPEPICFVCLDEGNQDAPLVASSLLRSCGCKFYTHTECWNKWRIGKTDGDCPYCGRRTIHLAIPMTAPFQKDYTEDMAALPRRTCTYKKMFLLLVVLLVAAAFIAAFFL
jgi:hypothetical protein